ncbi:MAG: TlpA family protein disulfide reductase [Actinomycetota bacterium]
MSAKTRIKPARERAREARRRAARGKQRRYTLGSALIVVLFAALAASFLLGRGSSQSNDGSRPSSGSSGPQVTVDPGAIRAGRPFPGFSVTDVDGRVVTMDSLSGKPTIIWFTTSYCIPCQIGAQEVARLDDQLGGDAFNVLVMFVDTAESPAALLGWREDFANPDWIVALDSGNTFAEAVQLRVLDTKLLLSDRGVLEDVDVNVADASYLALVRQAVKDAAGG